MSLKTGASGGNTSFVDTAANLHDPLALPEILASAIAEHRADAEARRRVPAPLIETMRAAGAFRLTTPREYGGFEAGLATTARVLEGVGRLDGSIGWVMWNGNIGFSAAFLPEAGAEIVWGTTPDPVFANSIRPVRAIAVDGGLELSGRWDIVSGVDSADWLCLFAEVAHDPAPQRPDIRMCYLPRGSVKVLDTWHVGGMRGTGSNSVVAERLFVPAELTLSPHSPCRIDRPLYRMPAFTICVHGGAAVVLGIAASAVDEIARLAPTKRTDTGLTLNQREHALMVLGHAQAKVDAARALLLSACENVDNAAATGMPVTEQLVAPLRAAMVFATETSREVLVSMYELGGSSSLRVGPGLEQKFRDGFAGAQHALFSSTFYAAAALVRLGMPSEAHVL